MCCWYCSTNNLIIRKLYGTCPHGATTKLFFPTLSSHIIPQKPTTLICRCPGSYLPCRVNAVLYHCSGTGLLLVHTLYSMFHTPPQDYGWNRLRFIVTAASFLLECRAPAKFYTSYGTVVSWDNTFSGKKQQYTFTYWHPGFNLWSVMCCSACTQTTTRLINNKLPLSSLAITIPFICAFPGWGNSEVFQITPLSEGSFCNT